MLNASFFSRSMRTGSLLFTIAIATILNGACAFKNEEKPATAAAEPAKPQEVIDAIQKERDREAAAGILTENNVVTEFVENREPGSYRLIVRWPNTIKAMQLRLNNADEVTKLNVNVAEFAAGSGQEYKIAMIAHGNISSRPLSSYITPTLRAPTDIVFDSKSTELNEDRVITANRVFIKSGAKITTNGHNLTLTTNKLFIAPQPRDSENRSFTELAHINTFTLNKVAEKDAELAGSMIKIFAKEAHGRMLIALVGTNGKLGKAAPFPVNLPESRGLSASLPQHRGRDGQERMIVSNCKRSKYNDCETGPTCIVEATSGLKGVLGEKGTDGQPGGPGGNAGFLHLSIVNYVNFSVHVGQLSGPGGAGGAAGRGAPGSQGGTPGARPGLCDTFPAVGAGPPGDTGVAGEAGKSGISGSSGTVEANGVPMDTISLQ